LNTATTDINSLLVGVSNVKWKHYRDNAGNTAEENVSTFSLM